MWKHISSTNGASWISYFPIVRLPILSTSAFPSLCNLLSPFLNLPSHLERTSLLLFVSSRLHPLWKSVSKWIDWAKSVVWGREWKRKREGDRDGGSVWGAWERRSWTFHECKYEKKQKGGGDGEWRDGGNDRLHRSLGNSAAKISRLCSCPTSPVLSSILSCLFYFNAEKRCQTTCSCT